MANTQTGIVQAVKKDKKGLMIGDKWYSNGFLKDLVTANKGDEVEVELNDKGFLLSCKILKQNSSPVQGVSSADRSKVDAGNTIDREIEFLNGCIDLKFAEKLAVLEEGKLTEILSKKFVKTKNYYDNPEPKEEDNTI